MGKVFEVKVRRVGTSLGLLIPKEIAEKEKIKEGEKVEAIVTLVDAKEQRLGLSIRQLEAPQIYK